MQNNDISEIWVQKEVAPMVIYDLELYLYTVSTL